MLFWILNCHFEYKKKDHLLSPWIHLVSSHGPNVKQTLNDLLWIGTGIQNGIQGAANVSEGAQFEILYFLHIHPEIPFTIIWHGKEEQDFFIIINNKCM